MIAGSALNYDPTAVYDIRVNDIEYRREGSLSLMARVYEPRGAGPFPTLIDIHGGAWAAQDKLNNAVSQEAFARSGLVVAAVDFRTSAEAPHPAAMQDIAYAVRWLKAHTRDFNGTPELLGGVGWSSGGHQVMLNAMRPKLYADIPLSEAPALEASLAYVIMGWPVIDPTSRYLLAGQKGDAALQMRHLAYYGSEDGQREANPQLILERGEKVETPPALLVQGAADDALTRMMAEKFVEAYSLAGGVIELAKYPGEPHGFAREASPSTYRARDAMNWFIARQLKAAAEGW